VAEQAREVGQLYSVARRVLDPLFAFAWNIEVTGLGNVPGEGGAIIAPNHLSVIDHFVVGASLPRRITYVGKAEYMDSWKTRYIFPALGMIPIDRGGGSAAERALTSAARLVDAGELFGIYPEGTRSRDGKLHRGHTGMARLALRTGAPIVPCGLIGTDVVQPAGRSFPRVFDAMRVSFGRPVDVTRYLDRADDPLVLRQITDEVMYEIRTLSGQEYVDTYASKGKGQGDQAMPAPTAHVPGSAGVNGTIDLTAGEGSGRRSSAAALGSTGR
jgi:1-acyl-sn-glycerol-3-phosphate acyltransferase